MAPEFEEFAKDADEVGLKVRVGEVDIDDNPILVNRWTIMKLPTILHVLPNREGTPSSFDIRPHSSFC